MDDPLVWTALSENVTNKIVTMNISRGSLICQKSAKSV